jgi:hypothetical protein
MKVVMVLAHWMTNCRWAGMLHDITCMSFVMFGIACMSFVIIEIACMRIVMLGIDLHAWACIFFVRGQGNELALISVNGAVPTALLLREHGHRGLSG